MPPPLIDEYSPDQLKDQIRAFLGECGLPITDLSESQDKPDLKPSWDVLRTALLNPN